MKKNLKGKYKRGEKFLLDEHEKNVRSTKSKIKKMGRRWIDRKKNPHDPIAYPVRFFRRDPLDKAEDYDLECVAKEILKKRDVIGIDNTGLLKKAEKISKEKEEKVQFEKSIYKKQQEGLVIPEEEQEFTAGSILKAKEEQMQRQREEERLREREAMEIIKKSMRPKELLFIEKIPVIRSTSDQDVDEFKKQIFEIIVDDCLYKDSQLNILFTEIRLKNRDTLPDAMLEDIIEEVYRVLDE